MNFLQLINRVKSEAGISGHAISSVENQTGEMARVVDWVRSAYIEIQNMRPWTWLWQPLGHVMTLGKFSYSPVTDFGVTPLDWRHDRFFLYDPDQGRRSRIRLAYVPWAAFDDMYPDPNWQPGRPQVVSIKPNREIVFNRTPDLNYIFEGEFRNTPESLVANTDVPSLPEQYHMAIVWLAVQIYAQYEEAGPLYQMAAARVNGFLGQMANTELDGEFTMSALA